MQPSDRPVRNSSARWRRRALVALVVVAGAVGFALVALRVYLSPDRSANLVREQLSKLLGSVVKARGASIGLIGSSRVEGLVINEPEADRPLLKADSVTADLSAVGAATGSAPSHLLLEGVEVTLRFDADGNLITRLPAGGGNGALPVIEVRDARVHIVQEGRSPLALEGASVRMGTDGTVTGTLADPRWGTFAVSGAVRMSPMQLKLALHQPHADVTPERLRSLPFVPPALWETLTADGKDVDVRVGLEVSEDVRYSVDFARANVTLIQTDRPSFRVSGASASLEGDVTGFTLAGKIADPKWGAWDVHSRLDDTAIKVQLKTAEAAVDQKMLESLPFVPLDVWQQVKAVGRSSADVTIGLWTDKPDVTYRVEANPVVSSLYVEAINLKASGVTGNLIVEDGLVRLSKVRGTAASGTVFTSGSLDFRQPHTDMKFAVKVEGLRLTELPDQWGVWKQLEGNLTGTADIHLIVSDKVVTLGSGKGLITEAKVAGIKADPIPLNLRTDGERLRFDARMKSGTSLMPRLLAPVLVAVAPPVAPLPPRPLSFSPGDLAARAGLGVEWFARGVVAGATGALDAVDAVTRMAQPTAETTYLDANVNLQDVDITEVAKRFGAELPAGLAGRVNVKLTTSIPLNNARDPRAYRFRGALTSPKLSVAGQPLEEVSANFDYREGRARVDDLSARVGGGTVTGTATAQIAPSGDVAVDLGVSKLSLAALVPADLRKRLSGDVTGRIRAFAPVERAADVTAWRGAGSVTSARADVFGVPVRDASIDLALARGTLLATDLKAEAAAALLSGTAGLNLRGTYRYEADLRLRGVNLERVAKLLPGDRPADLGGTGNVTGRFNGSLLTGGVEAAGRLRLDSARLAGIRTGVTRATWKLSGERLVLEDVEAEVFRGKVVASGDIGLASSGSLSLKITGAEAAEIVRAVPGLDVPAEGQLNAEGKVTFKLAGKEPSIGTLNMDITSPRLVVAGVPLAKVTGRIDGKDGQYAYKATGEVFGGRTTVQGKWPPPAAGKEPHGRLTIDRVFLGRIVRGNGDQRGPWRGRISLVLPYRHEGPGGRPVGEGKFEIIDLRYGDTELADRVRGVVALRPQGLFVRDVSGTLAGGDLRAQVAYRFDDPNRSFFTLTLSGADARRLQAVLGNGGDTFAGTLDVSLRGRLAREWTGGGTVTLKSGRVMGIGVGEWNAPVDFIYAPTTGRGELYVRESSARIGTGRASVRGQMVWSETARVEGTIRLINASTQALAGFFGDVSSYVQGQVNGTIEIGGSNVRSAEDLTANVRATLRETQALQLPILRLATPYLLPGQSGTVFQSGNLRGRLSRGVFRIQELTLDGRLAQMIVEGSITVAGRLDLDVVARTTTLGNVNPLLVGPILRRIPVAGPIPVGLIIQATELLSDRVIHLTITGTTRAPVVRIQPLRILSDQAVRFLLTRALR